jgi:hypothetical protein
LWRHESDKAGSASLGERFVGEPASNAHEIDGGGGQQMLEVRFGLSDVPGAPQTERAHPL